MNDQPITHGPVSEIGYKLCECQRCKVRAVCNPRFDFYVRDSVDGPEGPLYCYGCLLVLADVKDSGIAFVAPKGKPN